jgi:putative tricarboxylic transport membrane protein
MNFDRVLGLGAVCLMAPVIWTSWKYGVGSYRSPGAGFWPFYIALAMIGLGAILVIRPAPAAAPQSAAGSRWRAFAISGMSLAFYVVALEPLGYFAATAILLLVQLRWVEGSPWRRSLVIAVASAAISLVVFRTLLKVPLPLGILPFPQGW